MLKLGAVSIMSIPQSVLWAQWIALRTWWELAIVIIMLELWFAFIRTKLCVSLLGIYV